MNPHDALTNMVKTIRIENAAAAGTSNIDGDTIDTQGYDGIRCIALLGALTATQTTKLIAMQGDLANGSDATAITGAETAVPADDDDNRCLILDVIQPRKRYVTFRLVRGVANAVLDGMVVELYKGRVYPAIQDATIAEQAIFVPTA